MNIEQTMQMLQEIDDMELEHYERKHLLLLKWKKVLAREEAQRDQWANQEENRFPKRNIEELINLDITELKRKFG